MTSGEIITFIGVSLIMMYITYQLFNYFDISITEYGVYIIFYIFLFLSVLILPRTYKLTWFVTWIINISNKNIYNLTEFNYRTNRFIWVSSNSNYWYIHLRNSISRGYICWTDWNFRLYSWLWFQWT